MNNNALDALWPDYERFLVARYQAGGHTKEAALRFARGELEAILAGNHRTHGKPTAPDPQRLILEALTPEDREYFTGRAAILEHDGGLSRAGADRPVRYTPRITLDDLAGEAMKAED